MPAEEIEIPAMVNADKVFHFFAFGVLCLTLTFGLFRQTNFPAFRKKAYVYALVFSSLNGLLIEIVQELWVFNRKGDWLDFLFDVLGASLIGLFFYPIAGSSTQKVLFRNIIS